MSIDGRPAGSIQTIDIKVGIPELDDISAFWLREYPAHFTFADLYQECVNNEVVRSSRKSLERLKASRHFWFGDRMMLRTEPISALTRAAGDAGAQREVSLVLRRDYYAIGPAQYVQGGLSYTYVNAEAAIAEVIVQILSRDERACCFDLCTARSKRLQQEKSLADYGLWPAWEDGSQEFPERARLVLRPRTSWLPYVLFACAVVFGALIGYWLISYLLRR